MNSLFVERAHRAQLRKKRTDQSAESDSSSIAPTEETKKSTDTAELDEDVISSLYKGLS